MPIHLPHVSRRRFLHQSAAIAGALVVGTAWADDPTSDPNFIALLSDTHVPETPDISARGTNMTANLKQVVGELVALAKKPAAVFVNGDCAYLKGLSNDYANFAKCIEPLTEAELPLHLTMGNHDNRERLYEQIQAQQPKSPPIQSKHITILEGPHANWFLLDTLTQTDVVTGGLGDEQRAWLTKALDERKDKPALVMAHHTPQFEPPKDGQVWGGIQDTAALFEILVPRKHVKAFLYGHSHVWETKKQEDLLLINLPPVAYVFKDELPNGWVEAHVRPDGLDLKLHTIDKAHKQNGEELHLAWR
jgi:Icc protein